GVVRVRAGADNGRVADASRKLAGDAAGRGRGREVARSVERDGADRAVDLVVAEGTALALALERRAPPARAEPAARRHRDAVRAREALGPGAGEQHVRAPLHHGARGVDRIA